MKPLPTDLHAMVAESDEPITPELVLVDPDLARRARRLLDEAEAQQSRTARVDASRPEEPRLEFVSDGGATARVEEYRSPKRRLAGWIVAGSILAVGTGVSAVHRQWWTQRLSSSREASVARSGVDRPSSSPSAPSATPRPPTHPAREAPRAFGWVPAPRASYYLVQFYRGSTEIFGARPSAPRLLLPGRWSFDGRRFSLRPGRYRWTVRPVYGSRSHPRYGQPIVRAKLVVQLKRGT